MKRVTTQLLCAALAGGMALWHFTPMNPVPSVLAAGCTVHTTLSSDIAPITSFDTVSNIEANFNHARQTEGCSTLLSLPSAYGGMSGEQQMYTLFNAERTDRGLGSLRLDPSLLTQIDVNHSHEMEQYNYFNHPSPINHPGASHVFDRLTANPAIAGHWSALGENIAAGFNPASAVYSYMYQDASENWGHRVNILNSAFTWVGVGEYTGGYYGTYFTSDFLGGAYTAPAAADTQAPALSVPTVVSGSLASGGTVRVQVSGVQDAGAVSGEAGITGVVFYANSVTQDGSGNADTVAATQGPSGTWTASLNVSPQAVIHAVAVDGSGNYTDCFVGAAGCAGVNTNPTPSPSPTPSPTPSPAPSGSVSVSLNPAAGAPGTPVAASGSGYASREIVYLYLDQTTRAFAGVYAATSGSFSRSFNIPSTSSGTHRIYAIGRSSGRSASTTLVVTAQVNPGSNPNPTATPTPAPSGSVSVRLNPSSGVPGTLVTANGSGYAAREVVYLYLDQTFQAFAGVYAATSGSFSRSFNIPSTSAGTHRIYAIGRTSGRSASTTLVVTVQVNPGSNPNPTATATPAPPGSVSVRLNPSSGVPGTLVTATGSGYAAREVVYLYLDQTTRAFAGVYAATNGSFSRSFYIPSTAAGTHRIYAIGRTSRRSANVPLVVLVKAGQNSTSNLNPGSTPTPVPSGSIQVRLDSNSGTPGTLDTASGAGYAPREAVYLYLDQSTQPFASVYTTTTGSFSRSFYIPTTTGGAHQITAVGRTSRRTANVALLVQPRVHISYISGAHGRSDYVTAYGYAAGETVTLRWYAAGGPVLQTARTGATGVASIAFVVPSAPIGTYPVYVVGQSSGEAASGTYSITS